VEEGEKRDNDGWEKGCRERRLKKRREKREIGEHVMVADDV